MIKFKKEYNRLFLKDIRKAIADYNMIEPKDRIVAAISGGKDSIFLLFCLKLIQLTTVKDIEIIALHIDLGFNTDLDLVQNFCYENNIHFYIEKTNIATVVFEERKEKNPCSLCSKLRKGALVRVSKSLKANKIALGHNCDDVIETLFMNVLKVGKFGTFHPNIEYKNNNINLIRPLIYVRENTIKKLVTNYSLPVAKSNCPKDKKTTREEMKNLIFSLEKSYPELVKNLLTSLSNIDMVNMWKQR